MVAGVVGWIPIGWVVQWLRFGGWEVIFISTLKISIVNVNSVSQKKSTVRLPFGDDFNRRKVASLFLPWSQTEKHRLRKHDSNY